MYNMYCTYSNTATPELCCAAADERTEDGSIDSPERRNVRSTNGVPLHSNSSNILHHEWNAVYLPNRNILAIISKSNLALVSIEMHTAASDGHGGPRRGGPETACAAATVVCNEINSGRHSC